jgi:chromate transport protein ChrA
VYPIWDRLKRYPIVERSLDGIIAVSVGFVLAAFWEMSQLTLSTKPEVLIDPLWWIALLGAFFYIQFSRWPTPVLVFMVIALGFFAG